MPASPPKVLVVDDEPGIREMLADILTGEGYAVDTAPDGRVALEKLAQDGIRVIVLDMRMPTLDGWGFASVYRKMPGPHVPILVMTAALHAKQWCEEVRADGCVPKPFDLRHLLAEVKRLSYRHPKRSTPPTTQATPPR